MDRSYARWRDIGASQPGVGRIIVSCKAAFQPVVAALIDGAIKGPRLRGHPSRPNQSVWTKNRSILS